MTTMFLTTDEIVELTGYRQPAKQVAHLKAQRIPFHVNRAGHPRVARAVLEGGTCFLKDKSDPLRTPQTACRSRFARAPEESPL